jgi:hypothetical protein
METRMLETLRIHAGRGDTAAVDQLVAWLSIDPGHGAGGCLAPNLRMLELSSRGYFGQERFVAMVKSRRAITPAAQENSKSNLCQPIRRVIIRTTPKKTLGEHDKGSERAGTVSFSQHLPFGRGAV